MTRRKNYPVISIFVDNIERVSREHHNSQEIVVADTALALSSYSKISEETREKSLDFAHKLINYFTPNLLYHHHQDDVPVFTVYLGVNEDLVDINTHGDYYTRFIQNIPELQNILDELLLEIRDDLDVNKHNIEDIVMDLESIPRIDIKDNAYEDLPKDTNEDDYSFEELEWSYTRVIRTPYSELYSLYLGDETAGEIHIHIGKSISSTIITTVDITEKEKAQLMGYVHETILEALEEEYETKSTIRFYSEAEEDI